ncbi:MAG: ATP-binding cassette domain-containing protein [Nitriliruptorales bacterium]|nr:ATP-binding cassette domain-containing protein [Nitriliruptorales bacterium]
MDSPLSGKSDLAARPRTAAALVEVEGVTKTYAKRDVHALDRIDLELEQGSFSAVIGPSGCGKSTLLKVMAGLLPQTAGAVRVHGKAIAEARGDIGMMFQQPTLMPWRNAIENVLLPIEIRSGKRAAAAKRAVALELFELVGLSGFEKVYPHELSGGMAQRAAICRMLITDPTLLLLDEPFGALDELTRDRMNVELQRICLQRDATAMIVTHSILEAVFLSDRVYVMSPRPGRISGVVDIDLPRPRTLDMTAEPECTGLVRKVRQRLDAGGESS